MSWLFFTILSIFSRATYCVMSKVLSNKVFVSASTQAFMLMVAGMAISILLSPFLGGLNFSEITNSLSSVILVVLGQGLGNIIYFLSIKKLTSGTAQITFSSILLFNVLLSMLFLGLTLSILNMFGLIILSIAIIMVVSGTIEFNIQGMLGMLFAAFLLHF